MSRKNRPQHVPGLAQESRRQIDLLLKALIIQSGSSRMQVSKLAMKRAESYGIRFTTKDDDPMVEMELVEGERPRDEQPADSE